MALASRRRFCAGSKVHRTAGSSRRLRTITNRLESRDRCHPACVPLAHSVAAMQVAGTPAIKRQQASSNNKRPTCRRCAGERQAVLFSSALAAAILARRQHPAL